MAERKQRRLSKRERIAYHEAGHAVAAWHLGRGFNSVSIRENEDSLGRVMMQKLSEKFQPEIDSSPRMRGFLERGIIIDFAGPLAEKHAAGRLRGFTGSLDHHHAVVFAMYVCGSAEEASAYANWLWIRADQLVRVPHLWVAIQALAKALLEHEHIGSRTARQIMRDAVDNAIRKQIGD